MRALNYKPVGLHVITIQSNQVEAVDFNTSLAAV